MLRVRTFLDRSAMHGIGVFASEDIAEGSVVWEYNSVLDMTFSPEQWAALMSGCSPESLEQIQRYTYKEGGRYVLCTDNAQFMNHADMSSNVRNDRDVDVMYARKPIRAGEELLCDYREFCDTDDVNLRAVTGL